MQYKLYTAEKKVAAIIYCNPADPLSGKSFLKYEYVDTSERGLRTFINFARKFPTAQYINFYSKIFFGANGRGKFIQRINL